MRKAAPVMASLTVVVLELFARGTPGNLLLNQSRCREPPKQTNNITKLHSMHSLSRCASPHLPSP